VGGAVLAGRRSGSVGAGDGAARCAAEDDDSAAAPDAWTAMLDWLQGLGAVLNVDVVDGGPATGRFVVASRPLAPGQLLAAIPTDACWMIQHEGGDADLEVCRGGARLPVSALPVCCAQQACAWCLLGPWAQALHAPLHTLHTHPSQLAAANLLTDMAEGEANAWHPYFEALPAQDELVCPLLMLPGSYGHLLQHPLVVRGCCCACMCVRSAGWMAHMCAVRASAHTPRDVPAASVRRRTRWLVRSSTCMTFGTSTSRPLSKTRLAPHWGTFCTRAPWCVRACALTHVMVCVCVECVCVFGGGGG
jgi:hypothetical protein